jgi:hypothetical protein
MPKVYNKHHKDAPADAVYVGRPSKWGNPYTHLPGNPGGAESIMGGRALAISLYEEYLHLRPEILDAAKQELRGKDLVCWCAPLACHADILLRIANE